MSEVWTAPGIGFGTRTPLRTGAPASDEPRGCTVRQRDDEEFDAFVRARLPGLLRFGRALTGSDEAGADLVQDALERTLVHWTRLEQRDSPEAYVRRVMVNRNISVWRKLRRERLTDEMPDPGTSDRHHDGELWAALQELPARQRTVVTLRYYEDLTEVQVAELMGCTVGTVKSQHSKALAKLRDRVGSFSDRALSADRGTRP
jgi:RNA polymerase sigma-70 factor (sigma-E family)